MEYLKHLTTVDVVGVFVFGFGFLKDTLFWLSKFCYNLYCCIASAWFLLIHQIYESIRPRKNNGFLDLIVSSFLKRRVIGLTTVFLIAHLIFECLLLSILFQVDCTGSNFTDCKAEIDTKLKSNGFSNEAPSYAAMALAIIALSGIVIRLENRYQLRITDKQPLIRFSQGWNLGGIIVVCLYHILRIVFWSIKKPDQSNRSPIIQMILDVLRVLISYFITYDIYLANEHNIFYLGLQKDELTTLGMIYKLNLSLQSKNNKWEEVEAIDIFVSNEPELRFVLVLVNVENIRPPPQYMEPIKRYYEMVKCIRVNKAIIIISKAYPNLRYLNLQNAQLITDKGLCAIAQKCHTLQELYFAKACWITEKSINCIIKNVSRASSNNILMWSCPSIEYLDFRCLRASIEESYITSIVASCPKLKYFNIRYIALGDNIIETLTRTCHKLEHLNLFGCRFVITKDLIRQIEDWVEKENQKKDNSIIISASSNSNRGEPFLTK
ncbi:hypothetical protein Glove_499g47 [Diversispora epigaea]|uniref:Uncharacterized protein n=1 Tax=Diversispora epigaea TaxID=1348612 RepID=A0A397GJQ4_9GLOM|nr:hypothetical protein Glove_499g47 [Diversispora epigaea]